MSLACVYDKEGKYRVVSLASRDALVASGEWWNHPKGYKEQEHERQIRRKSRKGLSDGENASFETGSGT